MFIDYKFPKCRIAKIVNIWFKSVFAFGPLEPSGVHDSQVSFIVRCPQSINKFASNYYSKVFVCRK